MDHWGGVLTRSPFISQQLPLRTFQHRQKQQTVAGLRWDRQQLFESEAGGRGQQIPCQNKEASQEPSVFLHHVTDQAKSTWYSRDHLFSLQLRLFSLSGLSVTVSAVVCLIASPHSTLIKARLGPTEELQICVAWNCPIVRRFYLSERKPSLHFYLPA